MGNTVFDACGTSIFESMSRLANEAAAINLGQGFPEGLEPEELIEAAVQALRDGPHQYPPMLEASGDEQKLQIRRRTICRSRARGRRHGLTQHLSSVDAAVFVPFGEAAAKGGDKAAGVTPPSITSSTSNAISLQPKRTVCFALRRWTPGGLQSQRPDNS